MKYLTSRYEIASAMNFGRHPVLYIDMENRPYAKDSPGSESDFSVGCNLRVAWDDPRSRYADMTSEGYLYHSDGKLKIGGRATCLSDSFGRSDVIGMWQRANTPLIHCGDTVVVVEDYPGQGVCKVRMMRMPDKFDKFCQTMAVLEDIE